MSLVSCNECTAQISSKATTCPRCGTPDPHEVAPASPRSAPPARSGGLDLHTLNNRIRCCDPGHYLERNDIEQALGSIPQLLPFFADLYNREWFYMKIKANADHHRLSFHLPEEFAELYEGYKKDLGIFKLSGLAQRVALIKRGFGFRDSFLQR